MSDPIVLPISVVHRASGARVKQSYILQSTPTLRYVVGVSERDAHEHNAIIRACADEIKALRILTPHDARKWVDTSIRERAFVSVE